MKFAIMVLLIAAVAADVPAYSGDYDHKPMPHKFAYAVKDDYTYNNFGQEETSDGKVVSGSYRVLLPDGRTQIVTYTVDGYSGYVAKVDYDGYAKYPQNKATTYSKK